MRSTKKAAKPVAASHTAASRKPGRPSISNEELLKKALDLFLEQGFERTSIDEIAATAGVAKRTLYLRYHDKEALFQAALTRAIEEWMVPIESLEAAETEDLEESLIGIGRVLLANVMSTEGLQLIRITNAATGYLPEVGASAYRTGKEQTLSFLTDLLQRRIGGGQTNDWKAAAIAYIYLVVCGPPTVAAWGMAHNIEALNQQLKHSVHMFLYGVLPRDAGSSMISSPTQQLPKLAAKRSANNSGSADDSEVADDLQELQNENRRLRKLLLASMLEVESLKEARGIRD